MKPLLDALEETGALSITLTYQYDDAILEPATEGYRTSIRQNWRDRTIAIGYKPLKGLDGDIASNLTA